MIICGVAGNIGEGSEDSFEKIRSFGIAQEIEFVRQVYMKVDEAMRLGKLCKGLRLSIHAPYYINLASKEKRKITESKERILRSCEIGHLLGARDIVFHAGYYQGREKEQIYEMVRNEIDDMQKEIKKRRWKVKLCPETTGKESQFGDLEEIFRLMRETGCGVCIDFAHLKARCQGEMSYAEMLDKIKGKLGNKWIHSHYSGIEYGAKGEKRHLVSDIGDFKKLAKEILKRRMNFVIINESPDPLGDCLKMKKIVAGLS
ncbi:MAG: TIM barrel protein [Nanoarchaeota archaeon]|nr:TIM barrel protein [Nanoarchaeota archaeon]